MFEKIAPRGGKDGSAFSAFAPTHLGALGIASASQPERAGSVRGSEAASRAPARAADLTRSAIAAGTVLGSFTSKLAKREFRARVIILTRGDVSF